jgi:hypothetical protein
MTFVIVNYDVGAICTAKYLRLFTFAKQIYLGPCAALNVSCCI